MLTPKYKSIKLGIAHRSQSYHRFLELGEGIEVGGSSQIVSNLFIRPPTGTASITASDAGLIIQGNLNKVKFLKESGAFVAGMQIDSTDSLEIVTEATDSVGKNIELFAQELLYLYSATSNIGVNPGGKVLYPYSEGIDIGTASTWFDGVNAKAFTDRTCPSPIIERPLQRIRQMKRYKKWITLEEAENRKLSNQTKRAIKEAGGTKELEDWDYSTIPSEALDIPIEEDKKFAEELYQDKLRRAKKRLEQGFIEPPIKKDTPQTGIVVNYLLYTAIMAIQELADKVDKLEKKHG